MVSRVTGARVADAVGWTDAPGARDELRGCGARAKLAGMSDLEERGGGTMTGALEPGSGTVQLDTGVPHIARVYDYWLGGKDNYAADREAAEKVIATAPHVLASVRAQRAFLGRVVRYLVAGAGIGQFLDIGTGLPSASNTHEVARQEAPECRVVYVDNDPIVLTHARALLTSSPEGATAYLDADLRDTGAILQQAAATLDFARPVAVMLLGVLHCIPDADDPHSIMARLVAAVPPGSYLVVAHPASDIASEQMARSSRDYNDRAAAPVTMRTHAEVTRFFDGLELVEPGVVQLHRWRPGPGDLDPQRELANYGGVGRKP
jgi:O-methyltransferase involved in polyketide biosynthesis